MLGLNFLINEICQIKQNKIFNITKTKLIAGRCVSSFSTVTLTKCGACYRTPVWNSGWPWPCSSWVFAWKRGVTGSDVTRGRRCGISPWETCRPSQPSSVNIAGGYGQVTIERQANEKFKMPFTYWNRKLKLN